MSDKNNNSELLPCPCCAWTPELIFARWCFEGIPGWRIRCDKCGLKTTWWHSREEAITAWNTRAYPSELPDDKLEEIASLMHDMWAGWMRYIFEKAQILDRETDPNTGHEPNAARWQRQMNTPYADLAENEKESDRTEARKVLSLIAAPPQPVQGVSDLLALLERDAKGEWCFKSLSRDDGKFQRAIDQLAATPVSTATERIGEN